jgi:hypothetical protein
VGVRRPKAGSDCQVYRGTISHWRTHPLRFFQNIFASISTATIRRWFLGFAQESSIALDRLINHVHHQHSSAQVLTRLLEVQTRLGKDDRNPDDNQIPKSEILIPHHHKSEATRYMRDVLGPELYRIERRTVFEVVSQVWFSSFCEEDERVHDASGAGSDGTIG